MTTMMTTSKSAAWSLTNALRHELAAQKTQVLGLHMAYVDTDLTRGFEVPKSSAEDIVQRALGIGLADQRAHLGRALDAAVEPLEPCAEGL